MAWKFIYINPKQNKLFNDDYEYWCQLATVDFLIRAYKNNKTSYPAVDVDVVFFPIRINTQDLVARWYHLKRELFYIWHLAHHDNSKHLFYVQSM